MPGEVRIQVLFWHLVGGRLFRFEETQPIDWWNDALHQVIDPVGEQYFIRVSTNRTFEELASDPAFQQVMAGLGRLAIWAPKNGN